ncbi:MAG: hypothetical protein J6N19_12930 [Clostridium sp.]|nr:hypothetical protein [Clostridium sp.]
MPDIPVNIQPVSMAGVSRPDPTPVPAAAPRRAIGEAELKAAQGRLERYKEGKANYDDKVIEGEDWWKLQHWQNFHHAPRSFENKQQNFNAKPVSAWLFNSIMNKHADAMDNAPEPAVLPRSADDEGAAKQLSSIIPVIMENCDFEATYSSVWWDKLKNGVGIYGVFYNPTLLNGIGDVDIRQIDVLNLYWEPGIQDIQDSKDVFLLTLKDNDQLEAAHPELRGKLRESGLSAKQYHYDDHVDTSHKSVVVDWYYKVNRGSGDVLHYVQYVDDVILYASEDDPKYAETGFYNHGRYPFVLDVLYEEKGTPAGFGFIDIMRNPQEFIDRLDGAILDNALWAAKPRYFGKDSMGINEEEFLDTRKQIVHTSGSPTEDNLRPIETKELSGNALAVLQAKIDELKETSGNRDFSQGSTTAGVTAASAIAALQEAGSKGSRDMIKSSYRAYTEICYIVIELVRQFYDLPRAFRITGENGSPEYIEFDNSAMQAQQTSAFGMDFTTKEPVFDIKVKAQKSNPYSRTAQNELALQFYQMGFFNPQMTDQALATIDMMDFEGKEKVRETIRNNGMLFEQLQQMRQTAMQLAQLVADTTGETRPLMALQQQAGMQPTAAVGGEMPAKRESGFDRAQKRAAEVTAVR